MIPTIGQSQNGKTKGAIKRSVIARSLEGKGEINRWRTEDLKNSSKKPIY